MSSYMDHRIPNKLQTSGQFSSRIDPEVRLEEVMQLIGEKVRKYRRNKGQSQEQLGELVHLLEKYGELVLVWNGVKLPSCD